MESINTSAFPKYRYGTFALLLAYFLISFSPANDPLKRIISAFEKYLSERPEEKVYIHIDRDDYAAGETIWFKAYLTAGPYNEPSLLSNTIYLELINSSGDVILHHQLFSPDGFAAGQLELDESLPAGNYLLRSYTNWMRNSGEDYFFHKQLQIWNGQTQIHEQLAQENLDIQFFPEGGSLVEGIMSKVAFKAIGTDGLGKFVKGKILVGEKVIAEFESNQFGMGLLALLPEKGKKYKVRIESSGQELILPNPLESGMVMSVTNSPKSSDVLIKIQASENSTLQSVYLLAQTRGIVCASSQADISKKVIFVRIPKTEFPSGIAQITALDEGGNPLAERLVFIDHQDQMTITASVDKSVYKSRERVQVDIEAKDKEGNPVVANLSLSVFDGSQVAQNENKETIQSNLLLSSELQGHIESPGYYFNPNNQDRAKELDILMLTQGWRKFTIKQALSENTPDPIYIVERGLSIRGVLTDSKNNQPLEEGTVSYLSLFPIAESKTATSNSTGEFEIHDLIFFDSTKVMLHGKSSNGKAATLSIDSSYHSPSLAYHIPSTIIRPSDLEQSFMTKATERQAIEKAFDLDNSELSLEEVEVKGKRIVEASRISSSYGAGTVQMLVAGNIGLENQQHPLDLVKGRVAGVQITGTGPSSKILIQGVGSINSSMEPLILLNDFPIKLESLQTLPVHEIQSYTVWKGPDTAIFGARGANGVIGFYTKKEIGGGITASVSEDRIPVIGYQIEKEFYSPKYPLQEINQAKPDRRATLFWAPNIQTDSSGKASVSFYNSDAENVIYGEIEGISSGGKPGTSRFSYTIEKLADK